MGRWARAGELRWLEAREHVGRDPSCSTVLTSRRASAVHATIAWSRGQWMVRDLASTNGTFVNGQRIAPGRDRPLCVGDRVAFGDPEDRWELVEIDEPGAVAVAGGLERRAVDRVLALPDDLEPEVTLVDLGAEGWCRDADPAQRVQQGEEVFAGGLQWCLRLPIVVDTTGGLTSGGWDVARTQMRFRVSVDEEHVEAVCSHAGDFVRLSSRSHNYLLLVLGRARLEDRAAGTPTAEEGWRSVEALCRALRVSESQLNLQIHRARRSVPQLMAALPGGIIERRHGTGLLRLVLSEVSED
jgi:hypothetical protein